METKEIYKCSICEQIGHNKSFHRPLLIEKYCAFCQKTLLINKFYKCNRKEKIYFSAYCKECNIKSSRKRYGKSIENRVKILYLSIKNRIKDKNQLLKITENDLIIQYNKQNGKCYYTGEDLSLAIGENSISVDRLDNNLSYTPDNIVFTSWGINRMKNINTKIDFIEKCGKIWNYQQTKLNSSDNKV